MTLPTLTDPPTPPARLGDAPEDFVPRVDNTFKWLADVLYPFLVAFPDEMIAIASAINYGATSTTSLAIGSGAKTATVEANKAFQVGQKIIVANTPAPNNYMLGQVTSYDRTSGALAFTVASGNAWGSGTYTAWTVSLAPADGAMLLGGGEFLGPILLSSVTPLADRSPASKKYVDDIYTALEAVLDFIFSPGFGTCQAGGTANALTGDFEPDITALGNGLTLRVRAAAANTTTTPTFSPNGLTAKTIVRPDGSALAAGDIPAAGYWLDLTYDATADKWVLNNPSTATFATKAGAESLTNKTLVSAILSGTFTIGGNSVPVAQLRTFGAGMAWSSPTLTSGTTYYNTGDRPLFIMVTPSWASSTTRQLTIDGTVRAQFTTDTAYPHMGTLVGFVPPGGSYSVNFVPALAFILG